MPRRHHAATRLGIRLPPELATDRRPWHTVVMSRLGRNLLARRLELAMLYCFTEQAVGDGHAVLAVVGTATHRWLKRSCELLAVPLVEIALAHDAAAVPLSRDALAVMLADRVDATWVRPGGTIHRLLLARLAEGPSASVRVLVPAASGERVTKAASGNAIGELLAAGAVGYCYRTDSEPERDSDLGRVGSSSPDAPAAAGAVDDAVFASLIHSPHRWLIHCTRAPQGPWPGQSEQQFRDGLLLSRPQTVEPTPLTTLQRILTQQKLVGTSRTIAGQRAVVCFSALPLLEVIARRRFRPHLGRWDAEPYGLAIDLDAAQRLGGLPVIYSDAGANGTRLPPEERWRRQARGRTFDWTAEREWRLPGTADLRLLRQSEAVVFVDRDEEITRLPSTPWPVVSIQSLRRIAGEGVANENALR